MNRRNALKAMAGASFGIAIPAAGLVAGASPNPISRTATDATDPDAGCNMLRIKGSWDNAKSLVDKFSDDQMTGRITYLSVEREEEFVVIRWKDGDAGASIWGSKPWGYFPQPAGLMGPLNCKPVRV